MFRDGWELGRVNLRIEVSVSPSGDLVRDLHEWLGSESESVGLTRVRLGAPVPGALGPVADAVEVVLESAGSLASLASVIVAWLQYRKPDLELTIFVGDGHDPVPVSAAQAQQDPQITRSELAAQLGKALPDPSQTDGITRHGG